MKREDLIYLLNKRNVKYNNNISNKELQQLLDNYISQVVNRLCGNYMYIIEDN